MTDAWACTKQGGFAGAAPLGPVCPQKSLRSEIPTCIPQQARGQQATSPVTLEDHSYNSPILTQQWEGAES